MKSHEKLYFFLIVQFLCVQAMCANAVAFFVLFANFYFFAYVKKKQIVKRETEMRKDV